MISISNITLHAYFQYSIHTLQIELFKKEFSRKATRNGVVIQISLTEVIIRNSYDTGYCRNKLHAAGCCEYIITPRNSKDVLFKRMFHSNLQKIINQALPCRKSSNSA